MPDSVFLSLSEEGVSPSAYLCFSVSVCLSVGEGGVGWGRGWGRGVKE